MEARRELASQWYQGVIFFMIAWVNFTILLIASVLFLLFYVRSARPAGRAMIIGPGAYQRCFYERIVSAIFEFVITANYILYFYYPLPIPLPVKFPWPWWVSVVIAVLIGVPALALMSLGILAAGEETMHPKKLHSMYGGIYTKLRHPQAEGEVFLFPVMALLLLSPFLLIFSLIYFPLFLILCYAEEQDLLLRYGSAYTEYCRKTCAFWPKKPELDN
jgi:protein-S-isoprenylcysteine O-methyltransferase Ste14